MHDSNATVIVILLLFLVILVIFVLQKQSQVIKSSFDVVKAAKNSFGKLQSWITKRHLNSSPVNDKY